MCWWEFLPFDPVLSLDCSARWLLVLGTHLTSLSLRGSLCVWLCVSGLGLSGPLQQRAVEDGTAVADARSSSLTEPATPSRSAWSALTPTRTASCNEADKDCTRPAHRSTRATHRHAARPTHTAILTCFVFPAPCAPAPCSASLRPALRPALRLLALPHTPITSRPTCGTPTNPRGPRPAALRRLPPPGNPAASSRLHPAATHPATCAAYPWPPSSSRPRRCPSRGSGAPRARTRGGSAPRCAAAQARKSPRASCPRRRGTRPP
eukprot:3638106-Rhodomonas_salina.2